MSKITITVDLPDNLATEAKAKGLLKSETIEALLRDELRRNRISTLFENANRLAELQFERLTEVELESEIKAARNARNNTNRS